MARAKLGYNDSGIDVTYVPQGKGAKNVRREVAHPQYHIPKPSNLHWLIIRTASGKELIVSDAISVCDRSLYVPIRLKTQHLNGVDKERGNQRTAVPYPEIRGYVFAMIESNHPVLKYLAEKGLVYGLLGRDGMAFTLKQSAIDVMRGKCNHEYDPRRHKNKTKAEGPKAFMKAGFEFDVGDYVMFERGETLVPMRVLHFEKNDTMARVMHTWFGKSMSELIPVTRLIIHDSHEPQKMLDIGNYS